MLSGLFVEVPGMFIIFPHICYCVKFASWLRYDTEETYSFQAPEYSSEEYAT